MADKNKKFRFVVHEHHASHLHFDFRLEMQDDGGEWVLRSWAVPKNLSHEVGVKRLAIAVEDHPVDYIDFEGVIEEGYGAGEVKIFDSGEYEFLEIGKNKDNKINKISVVLHGEIFKGNYELIKTRGFGSGKSRESSWLVFLKK
ncbi:MAG: DNA polymerase ligase N-terminal domain-containing protein [Candidatus Pacebacteria bacterium]|nr:DNA polymerase ligase N-terminal domain-containing protein [Candidatus Paceibacterota bacterium]